MHLVHRNLARVFETLAAYWALPQAAAEVTLPLIPSEEPSSLLNQRFFHVRVVKENEEQMQYHLNSSCSSSEVKVDI